MKHLKENNETYINHFKFAGKIGATLIFRGLVFTLNAICPISNIPKKWNLEDTLTKIYKWNRYANRRNKK